MTRVLMSIGAGLVLGVLYTMSPLALVALAGAGLLCRLAGRGLDDHERRLLLGILLTALAVRAAAVGAMFLLALPNLNELGVGALSGDEAYNLSRALRARDLLVGFARSRYDYFVVTDEYGRNSYVTLLTWLQLMFGPTPFSAKLLNALLYTAGATLLFRVVRPAFGLVPALAGLVALLTLPSLLYSSVTLLKESLYFLSSSIVLAAFVGAMHRRTPTRIAWALAAGAAGLWMVNDLRRGATELALAGLACGLLIRVVGGERRRIAAMLCVGTLGLALVASQPALRARTLGAIASAATVHAGHVFTVGHAYKLLDEGFYRNPTAPGAPPPALTAGQASRFVLRGLVSFVLTPLPWQIVSRSEFAFLPEHLLWYLSLALLPVGLSAGWKRDPLVTALLVGYALPTAVTLALTNGNVGTLVRLRGLVTPFWIWVSVLGLCQAAQWAVTRGASSPRALMRPESERSPA